MLTLRITPKGFTRLARNFADEGVVMSPTKDTLAEVGDIVAREIRARAPYWTGALAASIMVRVWGGAKRQNIRIYSDLDYAAPLEFGAIPHFPNLSNITPWALAHGWHPVAFGVHMMQQRYHAYHFFRDGFEAARPQTEWLWDQLSDQIVKKLIYTGGGND